MYRKTWMSIADTAAIAAGIVAVIGLVPPAGASETDHFQCICEGTENPGSHTGMPKKNTTCGNSYAEGTRGQVAAPLTVTDLRQYLVPPMYKVLATGQVPDIYSPTSGWHCRKI